MQRHFFIVILIGYGNNTTQEKHPSAVFLDVKGRLHFFGIKVVGFIDE